MYKFSTVAYVPLPTYSAVRRVVYLCFVHLQAHQVIHGLVRPHAAKRVGDPVALSLKRHSVHLRIYLAYTRVAPSRKERRRGETAR